MGCSATDSHTHTATLSGAKRTQDDRTGETGCKAQRSTSGFLSIAPYCGVLTDGALKCRTSYGGNGEISGDYPGKFISRAECPTAAMKLTDCDGETKREINNCDAQSTADEDFGINYGGYIEKKRCVAIGSTDHIVAIAICCSIE